MKQFSRRELECGWCGIGTYLLILAVAWCSGGFPELWATLKLFFSGNPEGLRVSGSNLLDTIPLSAAVLTLDLPISALIALLVHNLPKLEIDGITRSWISRDCAERWWRKVWKKTGGKHEDSGTGMFSLYFAIIFLEEAFARWLFLGILYWLAALLPIPIWRVICFYLLFLLGNGLWALAHLGNYERRYGRSVLWVLPQFIGGIGLTIIYWRYGFWAALITHFAFDTMIWAVEKQQDFDLGDWVHLAASAVYALVFYSLLRHPPADLLEWMHADGPTAIAGWTSWEFAKLCLCFQGMAGVVFGALLYDHSGSGFKSSTSSALRGGCSGVLGCYIAIWLLSGIAGSMPIAILIFALIRIFSAKDTSMNAMCRTFWTSVPFAAFIVASVESLSFLGAIWFIFLTGALLLPLNALEFAARDE